MTLKYAFLLILKWDDDSDFFKTITLIVLLSIAVEGIFLVCEPGARMTTEFEVFGDELVQCNWYVLPIKTQRMYLIFLSDTQTPIQIIGYGGTVCDRETMKKVL